MAAADQIPLESGFGLRTEPQEILENLDLSDKVVLVTGGYSGIGLETTRALAAAGAKVHVPVRSVEKAAASLAEVPGDVVVGQLDLADLASVRAYAARVRELEARLDIVICNAGIMACPEQRVGNNWESQFAVNHLGHFVLVTELLPLLLAATTARVVCLSSIAHRRGGIQWEDIHFQQHPYEKWQAYAQAKTANALFALGLDLKFRDQGLRAFSVHPGGILTPLQRHLDKEEMQELGWLDENGELSAQAKALFKSPTQGCSTSLWAATSSQLDGKGGVYCEDCDIAVLATEETPRYRGVADWAVDDAAALRLWEVTEAMLAS